MKGWDRPFDDPIRLDDGRAHTAPRWYRAAARADHRPNRPGQFASAILFHSSYFGRTSAPRCPHTVHMNRSSMSNRREVVRPLVRIQRHAVAAAEVVAIDQHVPHAHGAHLAEGDLLLAGVMPDRVNTIPQLRWKNWLRPPRHNRGYSRPSSLNVDVFSVCEALQDHTILPYAGITPVVCAMVSLTVGRPAKPDRADVTHAHRRPARVVTIAIRPSSFGPGCAVHTGFRISEK
ncbi:hypothetical protein ACWAUC_14670 [Bradyrhizobium guangdongense]